MNMFLQFFTILQYTVCYLHSKYKEETCYDLFITLSLLKYDFYFKAVEEKKMDEPVLSIRARVVHVKSKYLLKKLLFKVRCF